jgi:uncharacterized protein YjbI with pentapeptide repeats
MRSSELEKIIEEHRLWVITKGEEGTRLDLSGAALIGANLSGADLTGADLSEADLTEANLTWADFYRANLTMANWSGIRLPRGTNVRDD